MSKRIQKIERELRDIFLNPDRRRILQRELKFLYMERNLRPVVKAELKEMRQQLRDNPHAEPEPTYRFDHMTQDERRYIEYKLYR